MKAKRFKINAISLSIFLAYALTPYSEAALVRDDVDYQIFRDFAENKGKFFVGATDLSVKNKRGQNIGNALSNVPMIDFSVADVNKRIATVVIPNMPSASNTPKQKSILFITANTTVIMM